ncbi:MAG: aminotransferase class V-fold PLP-dependent enzyme, partial [Bdellovibrionales bacterium]
LLVRLLSCLDFNKRPKILTTDSEFYSFERQIRRLEEDSLVDVHRVKTQDLQNFETELLNQLQSQDWDLVFISHVFFNSGVATRQLEKLTSQLAPKTIFVLDGYHSFFALPVDLSHLGEKIYFMAGGYKYAQSGEGCCFLTLPKNCKLRPRITGWFADMAGLENYQSGVNYSEDGYRFAGATMDYSAMYRMRAVLKLFNRNQITIDQIHDYVQKQQQLFLEQLEQAQLSKLNLNQLVWRGDLKDHGHFLTFDLGTAENCQKTYQELLSKKIMTDYRKTRLRFGFAMYHNGPYDFLKSI